MLHNWNYGLHCSGRICVKTLLDLCRAPSLNWSSFQNFHSCHCMIIRCNWMTRNANLSWNIVKPSHDNRNIRTCIGAHANQAALLPIGMCVANHGHQCSAAHCWEGHLANKCKRKIHRIRSFILEIRPITNIKTFCCSTSLVATCTSAPFVCRCGMCSFVGTEGIEWYVVTHVSHPPCSACRPAWIDP